MNKWQCSFKAIWPEFYLNPNVIIHIYLCISRICKQTKTSFCQNQSGHVCNFYFSPGMDLNSAPPLPITCWCLTTGWICPAVHSCKYDWFLLIRTIVYSFVAQVLLNLSFLGFRQWRKQKEKERKREMERATCDAVYCWNDSSPTYLISLFVIKNYSQADIINLPTQPYTLNGALQTSKKKWVRVLCVSSKFTHFIHSCTNIIMRGVFF